MYMAYDENVYYHPEKHDLKVFISIDCSSGYDYDKFVIWNHERDYYTWGSDSGCSCPTPFEELNPETMPKGSLIDAIIDMKKWAMDQYNYEEGDALTKRHSRAYEVRQALIKIGMDW